jgi:hypothetical protein
MKCYFRASSRRNMEYSQYGFMPLAEGLPSRSMLMKCYCLQVWTHRAKSGSAYAPMSTTPPPPPQKNLLSS